MKKLIKVLSVISIVFAGFSIVSTFLLLTFLWEPVSGIYSFSEDIIKSGPVIPIGNMLYIIGCLTVSIVLLATSKSRRFIAIEIISIVFLSIIFPALTSLFETLQIIRVNPMGIIAITRLSLTNNILAIPVGLMKLSSVLCLVLSGMRIADKINLKKQQQNS